MSNRCIILAVILNLGAGSVAVGQGLRVETQISDLAQPGASGQGRVLSSSLSLFHNGRIYDYVESADEVTIYEPTARRFTILNPARGMSTTVNFDEIRHLLASREPKSRQYINELSTSRSAQDQKLARSLKFQMDPSFKTTFDAGQGVLHMDSPSWQYTVSTRKWDDQDQLQRYLTYCDWTAKLNHILHPSGLSPEPRMALNAELRKLNNRIPVSVQLDLRSVDKLTLRAEHRFVQNLDDIDRSLIRRWDDAVAGNTLRKVSFRHYQESILVSQAR